MDATTLPSGTRRPSRRGAVGIRAAAGVILLGAGLSACSSSSTPTTPSAPSSTSTPSSSSPSATGTSGATTLKTSAHSTLGTILVTSAGDTVYRFDADSASPPTSHCTGSCAAIWPPVPAGSASPIAQGFTQSELGSITRSDGTKQLTVDGWPVYTYTGDTASGQTNGERLNVNGGTWWAVTTSGARASASPGAPSSSATGAKY